jgi:aminopeptidase-like protein
MNNEELKLKRLLDLIDVDKELDSFKARFPDPMSVAEELFSIQRSLVSEGLLLSTNVLSKSYGTDFSRKFSIPTGTELSGGWRIPEKWNLRKGTLTSACGSLSISTEERDFRVMIPSAPKSLKGLKLDELRKHLFSKPNTPGFPYTTSYYKKDWGFSITNQELIDLEKYQSFNINIESEFTKGNLHILQAGENDAAFSFSSYLCHPQLFNNELSGPVLLCMLELFLRTYFPKTWKKCKFILWPETLGPIAFYFTGQRVAPYHFNLTCVGHKDLDITLLEDRFKDSRLNRILESLLINSSQKYKILPFTNRASDERQLAFGSSKSELGCLMANPYHSYPQYHMSTDDISIGSNETFYLMLKLHVQALRVLSAPAIPLSTRLQHEPMLMPLGLKSPRNTGGSVPYSGKKLVDVICYMNGDCDVFDISAYTKIPLNDVIDLVLFARGKGW